MHRYFQILNKKWQTILCRAFQCLRCECLKGMCNHIISTNRFQPFPAIHSVCVSTESFMHRIFQIFRQNDNAVSNRYYLWMFISLLLSFFPILQYLKWKKRKSGRTDGLHFRQIHESRNRSLCTNTRKCAVAFSIFVTWTDRQTDRQTVYYKLCDRRRQRVAKTN